MQHAMFHVKLAIMLVVVFVVLVKNIKVYEENSNIVLGIIVFLFSCQREQKNVTQRIEVDLSHIDTVKISASRMINLETVDSSLLYDICALFKQDDRYFIWSRDNAYVFNDKGDFLFNISCKGQGPGEYLSFGCMFMEDGEVCILIKINSKYYVLI